MTNVMRVSDLLKQYTPGEDHSWEDEFEELRGRNSRALFELLTSIEQIGMVTPILLGDDGRVWDGHHRLCIAYDMRFSHVPVEHAVNLGAEHNA